LALLLTLTAFVGPGLAGAQTVQDQAAPAQNAAASAASPAIVATAAGARALPSTPSASPATRWLDDAPVAADDGSAAMGASAPDRRPHGVVGVGIGTNGYRDAFATVALPVGKTGTLAVAVEDTQLARPRIRYRSLDVGLTLGGAADPPPDCASAFRVGDRYVEPLWVTQLRGSALRGSDPRCVSADAPDGR
jgi:hypothetical protein